MNNPFSGSCEETARLLSEHADGELRGLTRWRVARHLVACRVCSPLFETLRVTITALRRHGDVVAPPNPTITDEVIARIQRDVESHD